MTDLNRKLFREYLRRLSGILRIRYFLISPSDSRKQATTGILISYRSLRLNKSKPYCRITTALQKTIEIQKEIDKLYPVIEENIFVIKLSSN